MTTNPLEKIPALKIPGLQFQVCEVTPVIAADWLKRNRKNRKLRDTTVEGYALDMKNHAWFLTHQGIAFDAAGNLLDGQHRLEAIVRARKTVTMFVSAGWPAEGKAKTMDAVDRGANRSLADQLNLQHGILDAGRVVQISNSIAATCMGGTRVRKSSVACVLAVVGLYKEEIKFAIATASKDHGLKQSTVAACIALGRVAWPDKTSDFITRLKTGENLAAGNPILHLRNWLMGDGAHTDQHTIRLAVSHHLLAFVEDRKLNSLVCTSNAALLQLIKLQGARVGKIRTIFGAAAAEATAAKAGTEAAKTTTSTSPTSAEAIRIGQTLSATFSSTDLLARVDNANLPGLWLADWRRRGWVESAGVREFRKTESFGKV